MTLIFEVAEEWFNYLDWRERVATIEVNEELLYYMRWIKNDFIVGNG